jgi:hypothetical protein
LIGREYVSGRLFYDGRQQGNRMWEDTPEKLIESLWRMAREIKDMSYSECYPEKIKWEIRIDE